MNIEWRRNRSEKYTYVGVSDVHVLATCVQFNCMHPNTGKQVRLTNPLEGRHNLIFDNGHVEELKSHQSTPERVERHSPEDRRMPTTMSLNPNLGSA